MSRWCNPYNLFLAAFSTAALHQYLQGKYEAAEWLRPLVTQKDIELSDSAYLEKLTIVPSDRIKVPAAFANLQNYDFFQVRSSRQQGPSCGWYAALNAKAIQDIIANHEELTAYNIERHVSKQLIPFFKRQESSLKKTLQVGTIFAGLCVHQITKLLSYVGVENYYNIWLYRDEKNDTSDHKIFVSSDTAEHTFNQQGSIKVPYKGFCTKYIVPDLYQLLRAVKNNNASCVHIVLEIPSQDKILHSILLTIIQRPNKKPLLLYFNSNGNSLKGQYFNASGNTENHYVIGFIKSLDAA